MLSQTFPGRYDQLEKISQFFVQAANKAGFNEIEIYAVQSAVDEACTNIIDHAYGGQNRGEILCEANIEENGLRIFLHDKGKSFIPDYHPPTKKHTQLNNLPEGGLGLFFIHQYMDEVKYSLNPKGGNLLMMFKRKV